jgi:hypothetical protein
MKGIVRPRTRGRAVNEGNRHHAYRRFIGRSRRMLERESHHYFDAIYLSNEGSVSYTLLSLATRSAKSPAISARTPVSPGSAGLISGYATRR